MSSIVAAVTSGPTLTHLKSVAVLSDPLNNTTNPKSIPGAMQVYTLRITNQGGGNVDNNTVAIVDAIPANTALFVQNLGGTTWTYSPVANANGCDPAVTHIRVRPKGTMAAASGAGNPYFEVRFRVRVN